MSQMKTYHHKNLLWTKTNKQKGKMESKEERLAVYIPVFKITSFQMVGKIWAEGH